MKKYRVILADPPWPNKSFNLTRSGGLRRSNPYDYSKISLDEIKALPVRRLVNPVGCHLFLWVIQGQLPYAFEVMKAWGFKYHCCITWNKIGGPCPFSFVFSTEFCLYGQIPGKWLKPERIGLKTLITEKRSEHSRKPIAMYELIEQFAGDRVNKIELFAREVRPGWDTWGDEVESDIDLGD